MKKTEIVMNKLVYLRLRILELSKILIYKFWYDYVKPKYGKKADIHNRHTYIQTESLYTDSLIIYIKGDDIYKDIAEDVETRFDTLDHKLDRALPRGKYTNVIELIVYLRLPILELSKILIYKFWYDYVKPKYGKKADIHNRHTYIQTESLYTDSLIIYIKGDDIYKDIAEDVETRFDTLDHKLDRALPRGKNKNVIELIKD